ncbi:hypothetical protein CVT25_004191 [Psilocybe cyanescens]|uniref:Protein kinase domain-containing protein n=1 Tax=Psilocybe cyanescens TaxID=93625 RepID=A0A409X360_PSICY|nr:hypothetical protein CVT25_004191 [Psilocybe cyanescens]
MDTIAAQLQNLPAESNDIFSLTDQILSDRLEFIEEIGFGNWGSVWLCKPKPTTTKDGVVRPIGSKLAVKLVHRSKTATTAARVRSLWNEMKIVRSFKSNPHPSIIPFHSFIITPSYALITMTYLPTLVPVEVEETKAREWFRFLLSGVEFLHKRGVVHNDIKPANILLSHKNIPVLVDFGFAEKYDMDSDTAFHSNLSYGTPEYLSPERARGLPHDTRKSDVWSLGVTFFEILVGRTPFEHSDGEQFNSSEDLEKYWARTVGVALRGKWIGTWHFSKGMEKLLQRMIAPNADLRCTAMQAMADSYWQPPRRDSVVSHSAFFPLFLEAASENALCLERASSYNSSVVFEKDIDKLLNMTPLSCKGAKENVQSPPGLKADVFRDEDASMKRTLAKSKSQPRVAAASKRKDPVLQLHSEITLSEFSSFSLFVVVQPRKRIPAPPVMDLSPIKASPNNSPNPSITAKENILSFNRLASVANSDKKKLNQRPHTANSTFSKEKDKEQGNVSVTSNSSNVRRPFGALAARDINVPAARPASVLSKKPSGNTHGLKAVKVLGELTRDPNNTSVSLDEGERSRESTNVKDRMREWERERERLREMERLEEIERERDEIFRRERKERKEREKKEREEEEKENAKRNVDKREESKWEQHRDSVEERERGNASHMQIKVPGPSNSKPKISKNSDWDKENIGSSATSPVLPMFKPTSPLTQAILNVGRNSSQTSFARVGKETKQSTFKHSIKASIDKTLQFYKSSTLGQATPGRSTPARGFSFDVSRPNPESKVSTKDGTEAWETEVDGSLPEIQSALPSPLPVIRNAAESEQIAADSRMDRMTIWMRNVEKVVEDAKQNFASSSSPKDTPLPALPLPLSRGPSQNRTSRLPRRVLAASQIFQADENGNISPMVDQSMVSTSNSVFLNSRDVSKASIAPTPSTPAAAAATPRKPTSPLPDEGSSQFVIPEIHTPSRQRRATVSTRSPGPTAPVFADAGDSSPSKRKEKSKSHGNLLQRHIVAPISLLEAELEKAPPPEPTPRLSEVLDRSLFISPMLRSQDDLLDRTMERHHDMSLDDLHASPCHVEPYPQRAHSHDVAVPDTPSRHRIEGVYDRFLMATSGVKRLGKGYQSDNVGPVGSSQSTTGLGPVGGTYQQQSKGRSFYSTRRPMPAPVSSDDQRRAASVDELGMFSPSDAAAPPCPREETTNTTVTLMRKAMKLIAPKATASRRLSRMG